jgi:hypothetical protein
MIPPLELLRGHLGLTGLFVRCNGSSSASGSPLPRIDRALGSVEPFYSATEATGQALSGQASSRQEGTQRAGIQRAGRHTAGRKASSGDSAHRVLAPHHAPAASGQRAGTQRAGTQWAGTQRRAGISIYKERAVQSQHHRMLWPSCYCLSTGRVYSPTVFQCNGSLENLAKRTASRQYQRSVYARQWNRTPSEQLLFNERQGILRISNSGCASNCAFYTPYLRMVSSLFSVRKAHHIASQHRT